MRLLWLYAALVLVILLALSACAGMPRGAHGERLAIKRGWLEVAQVSDRCIYEQRMEQLRVRCSI